MSERLRWVHGQRLRDGHRVDVLLVALAIVGFIAGAALVAAITR